MRINLSCTTSEQVGSACFSLPRVPPSDAGRYCRLVMQDNASENLRTSYEAASGPERFRGAGHATSPAPWYATRSC